jgi:5'-nucleotidase
VSVILLTNDDGIGAEGLVTLEKALGGLARLVVVAPDRERSAVSHGLTIRESLKITEHGKDRYSLSGTPADCVIYALRHLFNVFPDLVISGINHGANLGDDIMYSGTVAAAREASRSGIPSMAVSLAYDERPMSFKDAGNITKNLVRSLLQQGLGGELCLNVNFPVRKIRGMKITRQGCSQNIPHFNFLDRDSDSNPLPPRQESGLEDDVWSDRKAILNQYVSVTPLKRDQTDYDCLGSLAKQFDGLLLR